MLNKEPRFQLIFIVANDVNLLDITMPATIDALTKNTSIGYEIIVQMDGANRKSVNKILNLKNTLLIDEIRIRDRRKFLCPGDPSNNGHFHAISTNRCDFTIEIESDVIAINSSSERFDALLWIVKFFKRHPEVIIATSVIDYDCWVWKLKDIGPELEKGIRRVNRISSHFIIYNIKRFIKFSENARIYDLSRYSNKENYEDVISIELVRKKVPIAFFNNWEIKVRHCDEKKHKGSLYYKKDPKLKKKIALDMIMKYGNNK